MIDSSPAASQAWPAYHELSTTRLELVALDLHHAADLYAYASDADVTRFVAWPRHESLAVTREFLAWTLARYAGGRHYDWGLWLRAEHKLIGTCGLIDVDLDKGRAELGYVLAKPYWHQGLASEAAQAVVHFTRQVLGVRRLEAEVFPENVASQRVLAKLGMRYVETRLLHNPYTDATLVVSAWAMELER